MLLAALIDAGADLDAIRAGLSGSPLEDVQLPTAWCAATACGRGTWRARHPRPARPAPRREILDLISAAGCPTP